MRYREVDKKETIKDGDEIHLYGTTIWEKVGSQCIGTTSEAMGFDKTDIRRRVDK